MDSLERTGMEETAAPAHGGSSQGKYIPHKYDLKEM